MSSGTIDESAGTADTQAIADFLGLLACVEVSAFQQRGRDVLHAATVSDMSAVGTIAVAELGHFQVLCKRLTALGVDPDEVIAPFRPAAIGFERRTVPEDLLESLVKIHLAHALATDFHRRALPYLDAESARLADGVLAEGGRTGLAADRITGAARADRVTADRLSLWSRRLAGEVLARTQAMIAVRPRLAALFVDAEDDPEADVAEAGRGASGGDPADMVPVIGRMFRRANKGQARRVRDLGLTI
jgi:hypothetical protein